MTVMTKVHMCRWGPVHVITGHLPEGVSRGGIISHTYVS